MKKLLWAVFFWSTTLYHVPMMGMKKRILNSKTGKFFTRVIPKGAIIPPPLSIPKTASRPQDIPSQRSTAQRPKNAAASSAETINKSAIDDGNFLYLTRQKTPLPFKAGDEWRVRAVDSACQKQN